AAFAALVELSAADGYLDDFDRSFLSRALELAGRPVRSVMVPRTQVVGVDRQAPVAQVVDVMKSSGHSRVVVYDGSLDRIVGFVHAKDLLEVIGEAGALALGDDLIRVAPNIYDTTSLEGALSLMQGSKRHLAVVRRRSTRRRSMGQTVGIVTLEDVLEVLVGDLNDETDLAHTTH
ncbi:MAG: CBS domain-containing protein, partial [bacterium]|nr:CBS domain-containing protein [bacterium]